MASRELRVLRGLMSPNVVSEPVFGTIEKFGGAVWYAVERLISRIWCSRDPDPQSAYKSDGLSQTARLSLREGQKVCNLVPNQVPFLLTQGVRGLATYSGLHSIRG